MVIISSVTIMHRPDMTWNVLEGTLNPIPKNVHDIDVRYSLTLNTATQHAVKTIHPKPLSHYTLLARLTLVHGVLCDVTASLPRCVNAVGVSCRKWNHSESANIRQQERRNIAIVTKKYQIWLWSQCALKNQTTPYELSGNVLLNSVTGSFVAR